MKFYPGPVRSFTTKADGRAGVLKNDVGVSEAYDPTSPEPHPLAKQYVCIWDTGASCTVICKRIADELGISPSGREIVSVVGPDGQTNEFETNTYLINLFLPNSTAFAALRVVEGSISGADMLIGMDIISQGDFAITNCEGKTWWTFRIPSIERVDFVQEIDDHNRKYKHLMMSDEDRRKQRNRAKAQRRKNR